MEKASLFLVVIFNAITECVFFSNMVRICYFNAEARYRNEAVRFDTYSIDFSLCTHYVYAHAGIISLSLIPIDMSEVSPTGAYKNFTAKNSPQKRDVKTLISIGGPNRNEFKKLVTLQGYSDLYLGTFCSAVIDFCRLYGFDGLDVDWAYPPESNIKSGFVKLLKTMRAEMDKRPPTADTKYLLTTKLPPDYSKLTHAFDPPAISRYADYITLAAYDLPSPNPKEAWFGSPICPSWRYHDHIAVKPAIKQWVKAGLLANKTVLGISPVGRMYSLADWSKFKPGSPVNDVVLRGKWFNISNFLAFPEVCEMSVNSTSHFDHAAYMPYLTSNGTWVGYEDKTSINGKINFAYDFHLAGVMLSAIDLDDFKGTWCRHGRFPMMNILKEGTEKITRIRASTLNKAHTKTNAHLFLILLLSHLSY